MFNSVAQLIEAKAYKDKRSIPWNRICQEEQLSEQFIRETRDQVHWKLISEYQDLSEEFIRQYSGYLFWDKVTAHQKVSERFIEEFASAEKWQPAEEYQSKRQLKTLEKEGKPFDAKEYWRLVSEKTELANSKGLSPAFIEKHADKLSWPALSVHQQLPMPLIDRHQHQVDWIAVTRLQVLSERFIEKHRGQVEWETISFHQQLSERFINRHHAKMSFISAEQPRSEAFLYTHLDKMDAASVIENQKLDTIKRYEPLDVYVIGKGDRKKYIIQFHEEGKPDLWNIHKAEEVELFDQLEENGLYEAIEQDFPELILNEDFHF
ncbi:hypothetical protein [Planococcus salinus]|uniref:Uncharacterized protein n=1 Tax=Planococcus salinus TaxID=1848460 RepID=A0A3M8P4A7_9BACL|nr:hypothetical protein [Planococcus salinus]RNF38231.1 hypothetical protein EEX84_15625 [Planococcus salinus]